MNKKEADLTNRTFDWLKVLHRDEARMVSGFPCWICKCKCGNIKSVSARTLLRKDGFKSCGCYQKQRMSEISHYEDIKGRFFGFLRVDELDHTDNNAYWKCTCLKCGAKKVISAHSLKRGATQSCGCLQRERTKLPKNRMDLTGKTFDDLKVEKLDHVYKNHTYWLCNCTCGGQKVIAGKALTSRATTSCGCKETKNRSIVHDRVEPYMQDGTNIALIRSDTIPVSNTSGIKGVYLRTSDNKWIGKITFKGVMYRKAFASKDDAAQWRKEMEEELFAPVIDEFNNKRDGENDGI